MALKNLYVTTILTSQGNLEALIQTRLKGYYNNTINVRMSLGVYGFNRRKVTRPRSTILNETILATK